MLNAANWTGAAKPRAAQAPSEAALLIAYAADTSAPHAGIVQRAAVTLPLAAVAAMATRLVRTPGCLS
jgi:hypothetical protein